jgi:hypothetical protein
MAEMKFDITILGDVGGTNDDFPVSGVSGSLVSNSPHPVNVMTVSNIIVIIFVICFSFA